MKRILMFGTGGLSMLLSKRLRDDVEIEAYINSVKNGGGGRA